MDEDVVLLTTRCPECGRVAEVGYTFGRVRVASSEERCPHCGHRIHVKISGPQVSTSVRAARKGPKPAPRRRTHPAPVTRAS